MAAWLRVQGGTNLTWGPAWGELLKQEEPQDFCCALGSSGGWCGVLWMRLCEAQQARAQDAHNMSECLQNPLAAPGAQPATLLPHLRTKGPCGYWGPGGQVQRWGTQKTFLVRAVSNQ